MKGIREIWTKLEAENSHRSRNEETSNQVKNIEIQH